jgi:hypothetical protein
MLYLISFLFISLLFGRKIFTYLSFADSIYILEIIFVTILLFLFYKNPRLSLRGFNKFQFVLCALAALCLVFGIVKALDCHTGACLKELPILVYPAYFVVLFCAISMLNDRDIYRLKRVIFYSVMCFPLYHLLLYVADVFPFLATHGLSLWPNNNAFFVSALLPFVLDIKSLGLFGISLILVPDILGLLFEAQRGALVCFIVVVFLIVRRKESLYSGFIVCALWLLLAVTIGDKLSVRFTNGVDDIKSFISASSPKIVVDSLVSSGVNPSQQDIRYTSTSDRISMWREVISKARGSVTIFTFGLPNHEKLVDRPWRVPHNGFLSAFGRGGILCFMFYVLISIASFIAVLRLKSSKYSLVYVGLYFTLCVDALTQTTFDSPYSLSIVLILAALYQVDMNRLKNISDDVS